MAFGALVDGDREPAGVIDPAIFDAGAVCVVDLNATIGAVGLGRTVGLLFPKPDQLDTADLEIQLLRDAVARPVDDVEVLRAAGFNLTETVSFKNERRLARGAGCVRWDGQGRIDAELTFQHNPSAGSW